MATGIAKPTTLTTPSDESRERIIHSQLRRAGQHVKWVEAGSQLLTLLIGSLLFFLIAALVDHWVISLGSFGRWVLCLAFVGGSSWFVVTRILPLFIRRVNPTYSARAIEEAQPTLKNSLINFLLLKQDHSGVKESVIDAMEQRAASDIATVEVDTAIDRAPLIRMGYVLCGVMALVALYKIASPKDPFQTVARVVAPWSDISRPSRVIIREVQPGHASVYLGSQVEVIADVQGLRGNDEVKLIYTSADGQVHDRVVIMKNTAGGSRYTASLPAEDKVESSSQRGASGLQQGVQYHVEAGDAISSIFEIRVRMKPTIAVEKAELNFPAYTQKAPQTQATGEIKALEGTRVTIHARANQPIKTAVLEFEPKPGRQNDTIALQVDGQNAVGTFTLQLKPDRVTPWRESYQIRFTNEQGEVSEQPVLHRIEVTPDLPPEVEILSPRLQKVDLPADSRMTIEVRGVDPDFALFDLFVAGKVTGGQIFRKSLLPPNEIRSQATGKFEFVPAEYDLKPGTIVTYQGVAIDNRRDPLTGQPQPGRAETAEYTIQITAPRTQRPNDPNQQQRQPNDPAAQQNPSNNNPPPMQKPGEKPQPMPGEKPMPGEQQPPMPGEQEKSEQKPGEPNQPMQPKPQQDPMSGSQNSGNPSSGQSGSGQGQSSPGSGNQAQPGQGSGSQNSNNSQQSEKPPMPGENPGNSGQSGSQNQPGQNQPGQNSDPNGSGQSGSPTGSQNSGQSQPGSQNTPGNQGGSGQDQPEGDTSGGPGDPTGKAGGNNAQPGNKPQHDGEKFEKFLENLKEERRQQREKERPGSGNNQPGQEQSGNSPDQPQTNQDQPGNNSQQNPGGKPHSAQPGAGKPGENQNTDQMIKDLEQMLKEKRAQEGQSGQEPKPNETAQGNPQPGEPKAGEQPGAQQPQPMGQQPGNSGAKPQPNGNQPPKGAQPNSTQPMGAGNQPMGEQPKPGEQGGPQNGAGQKPNENTKGGEPKGTPRNTEGKDPSAKQGEQKKPGAGDTSDPGAGQQSKDPGGSGQGQDQNKNTKKEMKPDQGGASKSGEPGSNSTSKKQSDSKGSDGGDLSGGGKDGGGQSSGQQGNDAPGGSSAADEGAGAAKEQGKGETGNKAGQGQEATGKTGASGNKPGAGSATKPDQKGTESGKGQGGKEPGSKPGDKPQPGQASGEKPGQGTPAGGGSGGDISTAGIKNSSADAADEANLDYTRKVTDLVLERLRDQEHNPDPELAKRANLTPQELQEFARRWSQLKKDAETDPNKARELDEALRSLGLKDPQNRRRAGASSNDKQRDLRDAGGRTQAPSKYREQFDQFRKSSGAPQR